LKWSASSLATNYNNSFTDGQINGVPPLVGNSQAITFCNALQVYDSNKGYAGKPDWYLPTQKELMQAYIDGIYTEDPGFTTVNLFWSSSEVSYFPTDAWRVTLGNGVTYFLTQTNGLAVRCVSRG